MWGHVNASVTAIAGERLIATAIPVGEISAGAVIGAPPAVVEEVASLVVFHRVVNLGGRVPEGGSLWLGRLELRWVLAQQDVPEYWRRGSVVLSGGNVGGPDEPPALIEAQRLFNQ